MKKSILFLALFLLGTLGCSFGAVNCDPSRPPGFPQDPPPMADATGARRASTFQPPPGSEYSTATFDLAQGWNLISFPFTQVVETGGFRRKLLRYGAGTYYTVDPNNDLPRLNTRLGYLVYADSPGKAWASGLCNKKEIRSISLECGWNLLGCPCTKPAPWSRIAAVIGASTNYALDVAGLPGSGENYWISSRAYRFDRGLESYDIKASGASNAPKRGFWLFVWHPLTLTVIPAAAEGGKHMISSVTPASVSPGQAVTIEGRGFSTSYSGLFLAGVPVTEQYVKSWRPDSIVFTVPSYAMSGCVVVMKNGVPSNKMQLAVSEGGGQAQGAALTGTVQDAAKAALPGVLVMLGNGMSSYSRSDGSFAIDHIPAGEYTVQGTLAGHRVARGKIVIPQTGEKRLLITLTTYDEAIPAAVPPSKPAQQQQIVSEKGTLFAVASAYYHSNKRWWVYRVDVTEWGDGNYHWHNIWYDDMGDIYYELKCPGARIGKIYNFKIEWRTRDGSKIYANTWQRKMYKEFQRENFDTLY